MQTETLTRCHGTQTESQWLAWIRSALRSRWLRWRPRSEALLLARRTYRGPKKAQKWEYQCAICKNWYVLKNCEVDHYPKPAGQIRSLDDIGQFCNNLFCEVDNLRVLCKEDHAIFTLQQRLGITFEEARLEKRVNDFLREHKDKQKLLEWFEGKGYSPVSTSNDTKRRIALKAIFQAESEQAA